jgi:hypothetical protein
MSQGREDRRGTIRDWPVEVMALAVVMFVVVPRAAVLWLIVFAFGGVTLLARRGAFTPRK